jgi:hypothetical protein
MYTEARANRRQTASPVAPALTGQDGDALSHPFDGRALLGDPDGRIGRMIADAEKRGVPVPDGIRTTNNLAQVSRWWATAVSSQSGRRET